MEADKSSRARRKTGVEPYFSAWRGRYSGIAALCGASYPGILYTLHGSLSNTTVVGRVLERTERSQTALTSQLNYCITTAVHVVRSICSCLLLTPICHHWGSLSLSLTPSWPSSLMFNKASHLYLAIGLVPSYTTCPDPHSI